MNQLQSVDPDWLALALLRDGLPWSIRHNCVTLR